MIPAMTKLIALNQAVESMYINMVSTNRRVIELYVMVNGSI